MASPISRIRSKVILICPTVEDNGISRLFNYLFPLYFPVLLYLMAFPFDITFPSNIPYKIYTSASEYILFNKGEQIHFQGRQLGRNMFLLHPL